MRTVIMTIIMDIFNATWLSLSHTPGADGPSFSFHLKNADICMIYIQYNNYFLEKIMKPKCF